MRALESARRRQWLACSSLACHVSISMASDSGMLSGVPWGTMCALQRLAETASGVSRGSDASGAEAARTSLRRRRSIDHSTSSASSVERRPVHSVVICWTALSDVRAQAQPEQRRGGGLLWPSALLLKSFSSALHATKRSLAVVAAWGPTQTSWRAIAWSASGGRSMSSSGSCSSSGIWSSLAPAIAPFTHAKAIFSVLPHAKLARSRRLDLLDLAA